MLPVVLNGAAASGAVARLGPWLGRAVSKNSAFLPSLVSKLRAAGVMVGDKIDDIVRAAKASPGQALVVIGTIASLGFSVSEFFGSEESEVVGRLNSITNGRTPAERAAAFDRLFAIAEKSVDTTLRIDDQDAQRHEALIQVLRWARGHYGSVEAAIRAHTMNQAFFEIDGETVARGYAQLKVS